jgi:glutamyl-Q tRNA(Asp) synthetase
MTVVTRFAPSPTGDLHIGHAYSAAFAHDTAMAAGGRFLVRIEDIDTTRCRECFLARNLEDLAWLGLDWEQPPLRQSERLADYADALNRLDTLGVTYPCFCTRAEIQAEIAASATAPHQMPPDGSTLYPGRCRSLSPGERRQRIADDQPFAVRLHCENAHDITGPLRWIDERHGEERVEPAKLGDIVIARKDLGTSYHLAVVVDDAAQGVTLITRGEDLYGATHIHRALYALLGFEPPIWHHHALCRDATGRRLAKRATDVSIQALREQGLSPAGVLAMARSAAGDPTD